MQSVSIILYAKGQYFSFLQIVSITLYAKSQYYSLSPPAKSQYYSLPPRVKVKGTRITRIARPLVGILEYTRTPNSEWINHSIINDLCII